MNQKDGGAAFPFYEKTWQAHNAGMSLRDYFAAMAMQGMCANSELTKFAAQRGYRPSDVRVDYADSAYAQADAMLAARERK